MRAGAAALDLAHEIGLGRRGRDDARLEPVRGQEGGSRSRRGSSAPSGLFAARRHQRGAERDEIFASSVGEAAREGRAGVHFAGSSGRHSRCAGEPFAPRPFGALANSSCRPQGARK